MNELPITQETLERQLQSLLIEMRRQRVVRFDRNALAWLALVPAWTGQLALDCKFPSDGDDSWREFIKKAQSEGLCLLSQSNNSDWSTWYIAQVFANLAPFLPRENLKDALNSVQMIRDDRLRAQALIKLAPHLSQELLPLGLAVAQDVKDASGRAAALMGLTIFMKEDQVPMVLRMAQDTALTIVDPGDRTNLLLSLLPRLPKGEQLSIVQDVLKTVPNITHESERAHALVELATYLSDVLLLEALTEAQKIIDVEARVEALTALAVQLPEDRRTKVLSEAFEAIEMGLDKGAPVRSLSALAQALVRIGQVDRALAAVSSLEDEGVRMQALSRLIRTLAWSGNLDYLMEVINLALETALQVEEQGDLARNISMLSSIAQTLDQVGERNSAVKILDTVLSMSGRIYTIAQNVYALRSLAETLAQVGEHSQATEVATRAFNGALSINDAKDCCRALVNLVPYLPSDLRERDLYEALKMARKIGDTGDRIQMLINLAPYLLEAQRQAVVNEALTLAKMVKEEISFWMPDSTRVEVLAELRRQYGSNFLLNTAVDIGTRILQIQDQGTPVSPEVIRWAELASEGEGGINKAASWLNRQIEDLVNMGDTGQALAWISTAKLLSQALGGELETSVLIGNRRIDLAYRQIQDRRFLKHFLERKQQVAEFTQLLEEADEGWALHYIGMGGVGKTMLLRHITANLAPQWKAAAGRVDFDHLDPDFPVRRPGQLLIALADELQRYVSSTQQESRFRDFQDTVVHLHEAISDEPFPANPLFNVRRSDFDKVLRTFCDLLKLLPQPVILILDTCEELTKLRPVGSRLPNLEATFDILERIHERVPTMRVVFAGRRPLAQSGKGWSLYKTQVQEGQAILPLHKPYLRLYEIRGFTEDETHTFLTDVKKLKLSKELEGAILRHSPDAGSVTSIKWEEELHPSKEAYYNPFDLALYADWIREDPSVTSSIIDSGKTDPYVEIRIVRRIKREDVQSLLPAAILLRRFDKAMMRLAFDGSDPAFDDIYRELGNMEWIDFQKEEQNIFLEVNDYLNPRLLEYYKHPERQQLLNAVRDRLASRLSGLISERALNQLNVDYIGAVLRLLSEAMGAELWDQLAQRFTAEGQWGRARAVTERILGPNDGVVTERSLGPNDGVVTERHKARATVLATYIAAMIHEQPDFDGTDLWAQVAWSSPADPNPAVGKWLQQRALCGQIAATRVTKQRPSEDQLRTFWQLVAEFPQLSSIPADAGSQYHSEQLVGSLCAALEALLEQAESTSEIILVPNPQQVFNWALQLESSVVSPVLRAFAYTLAGRALALHEHWQDANSALVQAQAALPVDTSQSQYQCWADWRVPISMYDRVRLEMLHVIPRQFMTLSLGQLIAWRQEAMPHLDLIDAERLASATLNIQLSQGVMSTKELEDLAKVEQYRLDRQSTCNAHRGTQPLFTSLALGWLTLGDGDKAVKVLDDRLTEATKTGLDQGSVRAAEQAKVHVFRRMRMARSEPTLIDRLIRSSNADDTVLAFPLIAVNSPPGSNSILPPSSTASLSVIHAWWRCQPTLTTETAEQAAGSFLERGLNDITNVTEESDDFEHISLALDFQEAALLLRLPEQPSVQGFLFDPDKWLTYHPTQVEQGLRLMLRAFAVDVATQSKEDRLKWWSARVGFRWMAELALDEGELLALRLPQQGGLLLNLAYDWFIAANDPVGALIAAICSTIAAIHSHDSSAAQDKLQQQVQLNYERLVENEQGLGLPPWSDLLEEHKSPGSVLSKMNGHAWRGWLERLVSCKVWIASLEHPEVFTNWMQRWLIVQYGERLPVELDLLPSDERISASVTTASTVPASAELSTLTIILIVVGFLILVGLVLFGGYLLFSWLLHLVGIESISTGWRVSSYFLFLVLLILALIGIPLIWRRIRSELASRTIINLNINVAPGGSWQSLEADQVISVTLQLQQRRWALRPGWPLIRLMPEVTTDGTGQTPGLKEYRTAAKDISPEIVKELTGLQNRLRKRRLPIPLRVNPVLNLVPWEALLTLALPTPQNMALVETFQLWRVGELLKAGVSGSARDSQSVCVLGNPSWSLMVEQGWKPLKQSVSVYNEMYELGEQKQMTVLHVIGTPIQTSSGWRIRIDDTSLRSDSSTPIEATVRGSETTPLIRPESLPLALPLLVVIQAEPGETAERLDTEREQTTNLRACAAEVFSTGARTVIMLPMLPPQLAELVLNQLALGLRDQVEPDLQHLLDALNNVRRVIATWRTPESEGAEISDQIGQASPNTQLELALDVCLFARWQSDGRS